MRLLEKLINIFGVSGYEQSVREIIKNEIKDYVDEISVDKLGNLIAHKKGKRPRVMLAAHMDEIGLIIKNIDEKGKIFCSAVGGFEANSLVGERVHIKGKGEDIFGVITTKEISDDLEVKELPTIENIFIDTGLNKKELIKHGVEIGSYIEFEQNLKCPCNKKMVFGKALDDRIGCYILIELAKRLKKMKNDTYFVFTVQEEVGLYGAKTSAFIIDPDWAVAVDVTEANDCLDNPIKQIGKGPTVTIKDAEMVGNRCIIEWLKELAKKKKIPLQLDVSDTGTTDALNISISRDGVPSVVVGVAVRNIHTPFAIAHRNDIENAIILLESLLKKAPKSCVV